MKTLPPTINLESERTYPMETIIEMKIVSGKIDNQNLFDYESNQHKMNKFLFNQNIRIGKIELNGEDKIICYNNEEDQQILERQNKIKNILQINTINKKFSKYEVSLDKSSNKECSKRKDNQSLFLIVRSLKSENGRDQRGYELGLGDVIKLGKVEYKVTEINNYDKNNGNKLMVQVVDNQNLKMDRKYHDKLFDVTNQVDNGIVCEEDIRCRYCFDQNICDDEMGNLLIKPCKCKGSNSKVHLYCLTQWIQQKIKSEKNNIVITYNWKKLECEICKTKWPMMIQYRSKLQRTIQIERPDKPYIIIEKISKDEENEDKMSAMTLLLGTKEEITIGRRHKNHMRLEDISVSRVHCRISYQNNKFILNDNNSKYGTLIELFKPQQIFFNKIGIQVGRNVFTFVLKNKKIKTNEDSFNQYA